MQRKKNYFFQLCFSPLCSVRFEWNKKTNFSIHTCVHLLYAEFGSARSREYCQLKLRFRHFSKCLIFYRLFLSTAIQNPCSAATALCRSQIGIPWGCTEETRTNNGTKSIAWFTVDAAHFLGKWTSFIDSRYNWKGRFNLSVSRWYGYHFNAYSSDSALLDEFTKVSIWWAKMPNNLWKL